MPLDPELSQQVYASFNDGNADTFYRLLKTHPEFIRHEDGTDRWMWQAASEGKLPIIKALVDLGMDVNESKDLKGSEDPDNPFYQAEGPIAQAASQGQLETVRWLLEHGAKINYIVNGKPRCLPLDFAAQEGHLDVVKLLVEYGADIHAIWQGHNAITLAEDHGQFAVRDYLCSLGARSLREMTAPDYSRAHMRFINDTVEQRAPLSDWRMEIQGDPIVTLYLIPANEKCDVQTLFTVGLSDHRLPQNKQDFACTELRCMLAPDWPLTDAALQDPNWNWPVEWLKRLVAELRLLDRWPKEPAVFMNGNPPTALAPNTMLSGWLCLKALGESMLAPDYRWIDIHSLFPIYAEELALIREAGHEELLSRFRGCKVPLHVDPRRPNMVVARD